MSERRSGSTRPDIDRFHRAEVLFLAAVLAIFPMAMLVVGLVTLNWPVAVAAFPVTIFVFSAMWARWLRRLSRAARADGDSGSYLRLLLQAGLWALVAVTALATAIVVFELPF